jgi:putative membrane protein
VSAGKGKESPTFYHAGLSLTPGVLSAPLGHAVSSQAREGFRGGTCRMYSESMAEKGTDQTNERATEVREHLANERTLLSWVRTGLGLISLGIVVERAGAFVSQQFTGNISELLGLALAVLGCATLALGTRQFLRNRRQIARGEFFPSVGAYLAVVAGGLVLGGLFIFYVVLFSGA